MVIICDYPIGIPKTRPQKVKKSRFKKKKSHQTPSHCSLGADSQNNTLLKSIICIPKTPKMQVFFHKMSQEIYFIFEHDSTLRVTLRFFSGTRHFIQNFKKKSTFSTNIINQQKLSYTYPLLYYALKIYCPYKYSFVKTLLQNFVEIFNTID